MTQPDRHPKTFILITIALSLFLCLRFYTPPLTGN